MLRIIFGLLTLIMSSVATAERILETVLDPANPQQQNILHNGRVLIAGHTDSFMLSYNDETFSRFLYPIVSGRRLRFDTYQNPLVAFNSAVYFALQRNAGTIDGRSLYRFSGGIFTRIAVPGLVVSNCIVYGSYLYVLSNVSGTVRMYRYNGTSLSEVTGAGIPNSNGYQLKVSAGFLYASGYATVTGTSDFIKRYNGSSFLTLPYSGPGTNVDEVLGVPSTTRVYFVSHSRILYYNGSTVTQVFYNVGEAIFPKMWRSNLYFTTAVGSHPSRTTRLYRLSGASLTLITIPGAVVAPVPHTNPEIYNDNLYIAAVYPDDTKRVLRYDGTTFTAFFTITGYVSSGIRLSIRNGNLLIHPNMANGNNAFEYDGTTFTEIIAPAGRLLFPYINGTACHYLWLNYYSDASGIHWAYAAEDRGCEPPPPAPAIVIPEHLRNYERFDMTTYGPDRGWCWSEIIIDWDIVPYCPLPPCPDPNYELRMLDANNGIAWSAKFNKPSVLTVPLQDVQPYRTILSSIDAQKDLLVFEPDLVSMGIATVKLNMKPKQSYFLLSATTKNKMAVPLKVSLLNSKGNTIWEQTFMAPFSQQITATTQEPGQVLIFSVPQQGANIITHTWGQQKQSTGLRGINPCN